jgi:hypothetical protein
VLLSRDAISVRAWGRNNNSRRWCFDFFSQFEIFLYFTLVITYHAKKFLSFVGCDEEEQARGLSRRVAHHDK